MTENNLFDDLKNLYNFKTLEKVNQNNFVPLIKLISNEPTNLPIAMQLNKYFFHLDKDIALYALHFGLNKNKKFIKFMKKIPDDEYEWLKPYLQELYGWSDREIRLHWNIIMIILQDINFKKELDSLFGFSKDECKKLGIEYG